MSNNILEVSIVTVISLVSIYLAFLSIRKVKKLEILLQNELTNTDIEKLNQNYKKKCNQLTISLFKNKRVFYMDKYGDELFELFSNKPKIRVKKDIYENLPDGSYLLFSENHVASERIQNFLDKSNSY